MSRIGLRFASSVVLNLGIILLVASPAAAQDSKDATKRPAWTTSQVKGTPEPPLPYRASRVFPHLGFSRPTVLTSAPGTARLFVAEQGGRVFSIPDNRDCREADLFVDVNKLVENYNSRAEEGDGIRFQNLYGLTFHPEFERNRKAYLCFTSAALNRRKNNSAGGTKVVEVLVDRNNPPRVQLESQRTIITWKAGGHNGGCLKFGHDGMLYVSTGDGGEAFPPDGLNSGQDVSNLLAAILRIDVDRSGDDLAYSIPKDNPFVSTPDARGEIWSYGMRNPWKFSFDRKTGDLWVGDVGWELWELIYRVNAGDNWGWSLAEGSQPVRPEQRVGPTPVKPPTVEIPHTEAASITGGFVYRGKKLPELDGHYIFGDWETRRFWGVKVDGENVGPRRELVEPTVRIVGFAERNDGELLLLDYDDGSIHELVRNEVESDGSEFPRKLSETGLFASTKNHQPAQGVVPFVINSPQWKDHATSDYWIGLPGNGSVGIRDNATKVAGSMFSRSIDYPVDSVLMKTLSLELTAGDSETSRRIETQLLHFNGYDWRGYTYQWNEDQTDAELVAATGTTTELTVRDESAPGGKRQQKWRFPSRMECIRCHNPWAEFSLAFNAAQLNRPLSGSKGINQLEHFYATGIIRDAPVNPDPEDQFAVVADPRPVSQRPRLVDPFDSSVATEQRARSYLHANCAHCHRFNGGGSARIYLPFDKSIHKSEALDTPPALGAFGIENARIIAAGEPDRSVLYFRMAKTGAGHMPHLGTKLIDARGVRLIHDWISHMPLDLELSRTLESLIALDEPTVLAEEKRLQQVTRWQLAKQSAKRSGRERPTLSDMDAASERVVRDAANRKASRERKRQSLVTSLLSKPSSAVYLSRKIREDQLPQFVRDFVVTSAASHESIIVRDLFESFLRDDHRTERLGEDIDPEKLLAIEGDANRGRDLFFNSKGLSCRNCHQVGKKGGQIGPELTTIAKKLNRKKLLDSILHPSREVDPKFAAWLVQTVEGKVYSGLLIERNDKFVLIRNGQGRENRIPTEDIEEMFRQLKSLMPEQLLRDLTAPEAANLLAWLNSLK